MFIGGAMIELFVAEKLCSRSVGRKIRSGTDYVSLTESKSARVDNISPKNRAWASQDEGE